MSEHRRQRLLASLHGRSLFSAGGVFFVKSRRPFISLWVRHFFCKKKSPDFSRLFRPAVGYRNAIS